MAIDDIDISSYFARIGYDGPDSAPPTLETLRRLQLCHACSIPFENFDVLLERPIDLSGKGLFHKLVASNRGGYCFEQNGLMLKVLNMLGYESIGLSARVMFSATSAAMPARTHLFAKVMLDDIPWLVDVGVGGFTPTEPLRMDTQSPQQTLHDTRRIIRSQEPSPDGFDHWFHQVLVDDQWKNVYEFTGEQMLGIDREVGNWWTSASPESTFRDKLMVAMASPDGSRHSLATRKYNRRRGGEPIESIEIESSQQLIELLDQRFGLRFPAGTLFGLDGL